MNHGERRTAPRLAASIYTLCHETHGQRILIVSDISATGFCFVDRTTARRVGDEITLEFPTGLMIAGVITNANGERNGVRITRVNAWQYYNLLGRLFKQFTPPFGHKAITD